MPSIGETLKNGRIQKGASEETVAKILKIKVERLKELESNQFDHFAAPVYVRSFIRHYASYLGLDAPALVQQYEKEFPEPERKPIFDLKEDPRTQTFIRHQPPVKTQGVALTSTGQFVTIGLLILILVGVFFGWMLIKQSPQTILQPYTPSPVEPAPPPPPPEPQVLTDMPSETAGTTNASKATEVWSTIPSTHLDTSLSLNTNSVTHSQPPSSTLPKSLPGIPVTAP